MGDGMIRYEKQKPPSLLSTKDEKSTFLDHITQFPFFFFFIFFLLFLICGYDTDNNGSIL